MKRPAYTLVEALITGVVVGTVLLVATILLANERARTRDALRLADMSRVASAFSLLYAQSASYAAAGVGCSKLAQPVSTCSIDLTLPGLPDIEDPGKYEYLVTRVPDREDYGIRFRLERSHASLPAGYHTLSKTGIR